MAKNVTTNETINNAIKEGKKTMLLDKTNNKKLETIVSDFRATLGKESAIQYKLAIMAYSVVSRKLATCASFGESVDRSKQTISKYVKAISWLIENDVLAMIDAKPELFSMAKIGEYLAVDKYADAFNGKKPAELLTLTVKELDALCKPSETETDNETETETASVDDVMVHVVDDDGNEYNVPKSVLDKYAKKAE